MDKLGLNPEPFYLKFGEDYLELNVDVKVIGEPKLVEGDYIYEIKFLTERALKIINNNHE